MSDVSPTANPTDGPDAFDRASFYVERLKYRGGPGHIEVVTDEVVARQFEQMKADGATLSVATDELMNALQRYGDSLSRAFGIDPRIAKSAFADGVMHGIAIASNLSAPTPQ